MAKKTECPVCGLPMWQGAKSSGAMCCRPFRRSLTRDEKVALGIVIPMPANVCLYCAETFTPSQVGREFCCVKCANRWKVNLSRRSRRPPGRKLTRWQRDSLSPGLSLNERYKLLHRWQRCGVRCAYCESAPVETVDHVVPLARGGTNREGNLNPACRSCNSSKGARLLIEWRQGRRAGVTVTPWTTRPQKVRVEKPLKVKTSRFCARCGSQTLRPKFCSLTCAKSPLFSFAPKYLLTEEERAERKRAARRAWGKTPAGRAAKRRNKSRARARRRESVGQLQLTLAV